MAIFYPGWTNWNSKQRECCFTGCFQSSQLSKLLLLTSTLATEEKKKEKNNKKHDLFSCRTTFTGFQPNVGTEQLSITTAAKITKMKKESEVFLVVLERKAVARQLITLAFSEPWIYSL